MTFLIGYYDVDDRKWPKNWRQIRSWGATKFIFKLSLTLKWSYARINFYVIFTSFYRHLSSFIVILSSFYRHFSDFRL